MNSRTPLALALLVVAVFGVMYAVIFTTKKNDSPTTLTQVPVKSQVAALEGSGSGLALWYKFDEGSGQVAADSSGNNRSGTLVNNPSWVGGKIGGALNFTGANNGTAVTVPMNISFPSTVCVWVKPVSSASQRSMEILRGFPFEFGLSGSGSTYDAYIYNGGQGWIPASPVQTGTWQHLCVSMSGTNAAMYINGAQKASGDFTSTGGSIRIGDRDNYQTFDGDMDDVRIYDRALAGSEIAELYNQAVPVDPNTEYTLTISNGNNGSVTSNPSGISCGSTCQARYKVGTNISLTASPSSGYIAGFSGCSSTGANTCSLSLYSNTTVSISYDAIPPAPAISSVSVASVKSASATITWTTDQDSDTKIEYGLTTSYGSETGLNSTLTKSHSQTISGLQANTTYNFRVVSANRYGLVSRSSNQTFTTNGASISKPDYFGAKAVSSNQVNLAWLASSVEDGSVASYSVYRNGQVIATVPHSLYVDPYADTLQQYYQDMSVVPGSTYTYNVSGKDNLGNTSLLSETRTVIVPTGLPGIVPSNRLTNWIPGVTVGVIGGIPNRTRIIDVTQAPYFADKTGVENSADVMNQAVENAVSGDVIYIPTGTYRMDRYISVNAKSGITIRGDGQDKTILKCPAGCLYMRGYTYNGYQDDKILSGIYRGSTQITVSDVSNYRVGAVAEIMTGNDANSTVMSPSGLVWKLRSQMIRIKSISGNTITFEPPIVSNSFLPNDSWLEPDYRAFSDFGVEDMTLRGNGTAQRVARAEFGFNIWFKNVDFFDYANYGLDLAQVGNCEVRHSRIKGRSLSGTNGGGLLTGGMSGCLIEDNIITQSYPLTQINGSTGNVIAYNTFLDGEINVNHGAHNSFNLYEGNYVSGSQFKSDGYYGSASEDTYLRNKGAVFYAFKRLSRNFSAVGNIDGIYSVGQPNIGNGYSDGFAMPSIGRYWKDWNPTVGPTIRGLFTKTGTREGTIKIYNHDNALRLFGYMKNLCNGLNVETNPTAFGCDHPTTLDWGTGDPSQARVYYFIKSLDLNTDTATVFGDPIRSLELPSYSITDIGIWPRSEGFQEIDMDVGLSLIRVGNYDDAISSIPVLQKVPSGMSIPVSFYRTSKPAFFGTLAWPPFDPNNPGAGTIPSLYRYQNNTEAPGVGGDTPAPTCTSFTYSDWSVCSSSGTQTRTITSSSPLGCVGGTPVLSQTCTPPSDTTLPSVSITSPTVGQTVNGTITISATAGDNVGVVGVQFWDGNVLLSDDTSSPYSYAWNTVSAVNGSHTLKAVARDVAGNTKEATVTVTVSNIVQDGPDTTKPTIPQNALAVLSGGNTATFSWSASTDPVVSGQTTSGISKYNVYRNGTFLRSVTTLSTSDSALAYSTSYCYAVEAEDVALNISTRTNTSCVTTGSAPSTPDTTPPSVPTNLTGSAVSQAQVNLSWGASTDPVVSGAVTSGLVGYKIYRNGVFITNVTGATTFQNNSGLTPNTTYTYQVSAYDSAIPSNESAKSNQITVITPPAPSTGIQIGDRVQTTNNLKVRATASTKGSVVGTAKPGTKGTVMAGPAYANSYTWWNISYDNGVRGWSAQPWLIKIQ